MKDTINGDSTREREREKVIYIGLYAEILQRGGGVFKKEGGAQLQAASGGALEDNLKGVAPPPVHPCLYLTSFTPIRELGFN